MGAFKMGYGGRGFAAQVGGTFYLKRSSHAAALSSRLMFLRERLGYVSFQAGPVDGARCKVSISASLQ